VQIKLLEKPKRNSAVKLFQFTCNFNNNDSKSTHIITSRGSSHCSCLPFWLTSTTAIVSYPVHRTIEGQNDSSHFFASHVGVTTI